MFARYFSILALVCLVNVTDSSAQVVQYPNGKRIKILSTSAGAHQLSGNQQRYIVSPQNEFYVDPKKQELDTKEARARLAYPSEDESESEDGSRVQNSKLRNQ